MPPKGQHINFRLPDYMYNDMKKLGLNLRLKENSKIIRFCIIFTITALSKLDKDVITESLGIAIGDMMFGTEDG